MSRPDRVFVNIYGHEIGCAIGSAYASRGDADRASSSKRVACVEYGLDAVNSTAIFPVLLSEVIFARVNHLASKNKCTPAELVASAIGVHEAIPDEIRLLLRRYAAEHNVKFATAVAECCRGFLTEAVR